MLVVKLGGSLAGTEFLNHWLDTLASLSQKGLVVVPGGGVFADNIRQLQTRWKFDDRTAHQMALLAMHQYGLMLASFRTEFQIAVSAGDIHGVLAEQKIAVWTPELNELDAAEVAASWEITSDSLAVWLAGRIEAKQLAIVKSSPRSGLLAGPSELVRNGVLDRGFLTTWRQKEVDLKFYHCSDYRAFSIDFSQSGDCPELTSMDKRKVR